MSGELAWFKSTYSSDEGGNCVEFAVSWCKSTYSGAEGGNRVEIATHPHAVHVRDSKNTARPALCVRPAAWTAFIRDLAGILGPSGRGGRTSSGRSREAAEISSLRFERKLIYSAEGYRRRLYEDRHAGEVAARVGS